MCNYPVMWILVSMLGKLSAVQKVRLPHFVRETRCDEGCTQALNTKTAQGWPKLWANVRALFGIFSQSVGPCLAIWANPVQFSFKRATMCNLTRFVLMCAKELEGSTSAAHARLNEMSSGEQNADGTAARSQST